MNWRNLFYCLFAATDFQIHQRSRVISLHGFQLNIYGVAKIAAVTSTWCPRFIMNLPDMRILRVYSVIEESDRRKFIVAAIQHNHPDLADRSTAGYTMRCDVAYLLRIARQRDPRPPVQPRRVRRQGGIVQGTINSATSTIFASAQNPDQD